MKAIGAHLFATTLTGKKGNSQLAYVRAMARDLQLLESWYRDAIYDNPELVIAPCRASGLVSADEVWLPWGVEVKVDAGPMDVLLVSSYGRIGIVETKLSYNPQKRREVVAQVLDYALALQETDYEDLPDLPNSEYAPDIADLQESLSAGRFLLVIAGDALDSRALRLGQGLLSRHLTSEWNLAMVDLNIYRPTQNQSPLLIVPELLGTIQADVRHVVRVKVDGEKSRAKVVVEHVTTDMPSGGSGSKLASVDEFLEKVRGSTPEASDAAARIIDSLKEVVDRSDGKVKLDLKTGVNLYWASPEGDIRVVALRSNPRVQIWLDYLMKKGHVELANRIAKASRAVVAFTDNDKSGSVDVSNRNVDQVIQLLRGIGDLLIQSTREPA